MDISPRFCIRSLFYMCLYVSGALYIQRMLLLSSIPRSFLETLSTSKRNSQGSLGPLPGSPVLGSSVLWAQGYSTACAWPGASRAALAMPGNHQDYPGQNLGPPELQLARADGACGALVDSGPHACHCAPAFSPQVPFSSLFKAVKPNFYGVVVAFECLQYNLMRKYNLYNVLLSTLVFIGTYYNTDLSKLSFLN